MVDADAILVSELGRLAPLGGFDGADWADVMRRAGSARHRRLAPRASRRSKSWLVFAVVVVVLGIAVPALAFRSEIIDFFSASAAPKSVVVYFDRMQVEGSIPFTGSNPGILASEARRITSETIGGKRSVLYIAPTKKGGFCALWTSNYSPNCYPTRPTGRDRYATIGWLSAEPSLGVDTLQGEVFVRGSTVTLTYADGKTTPIPYTWVTAPIHAGFFLYSIPTDRRLGKVRPLTVTVTLGKRVLFRQPIDNVSETSRFVDHTDRWGQSIQSTLEAVWSKRRLLYSFLNSDNSLDEAWVMPSRRSRTRRCLVATFYFGCGPKTLVGAPVQLQLLGDSPQANVLLWGQVSSRVRQVELLYQDGRRSFITAKDGTVLAEIAASHNAVGHRLTSAIGLDRAHHKVGSEAFNPRQRGLYPCKKPKNYGFGVTACP